MATGADDHYAPFQHQGTGTINTIVLALLSMIAEEKENVIFAMEEPETAIPPYSQKAIITHLTRLSTQAIFTSHSPFVLEEFKPHQIVLVRRNITGIVSAHPVTLPSTIKPKAYRKEFRERFSEALLAQKILITEGKTELDAYSTAARRIAELIPDSYLSLEGYGITVFDAQSETAIASYAAYFKSLGKTVLAVFDQQNATRSQEIRVAADLAFESRYQGFEDLMINETPIAKLKAFALKLVAEGEFPTHIRPQLNEQSSDLDIQSGLKEYLRWAKGAGSAADIIAECSIQEIPVTIVNNIDAIKSSLEQQNATPSSTVEDENEPS